MSVRTLTLHLDTSVVGGYYDREYRKETRQLWDLWRAGRFRFISSVVVEDEIEPTPKQVRRLYAETFPEENRLPLSLEDIELAPLYVAQGVVGTKYLSDARHVAVCALAGIAHVQRQLKMVGVSFSCRYTRPPGQLEFPASGQCRAGGGV